jgi:hypothetical protein
MKGPRQLLGPWTIACAAKTRVQSSWAIVIAVEGSVCGYCVGCVLMW